MTAEHHSSRRARALKRDAARQQKRRDKLKAARAPTTHVLNRALAEALFHRLDVEREKGVPVKEAVVSVQEVLAYTTLILTRGTNAIDSYDREAVVGAIRARMSRR